MGMACIQCQCQGSRPATAGKKASVRITPVQRSHAAPLDCDRNQTQPRPPSQNGNPKATMPKVCNSKSLRYAPEGPIQFCTARGPVTLEEVLKDGSAG